jgi:hypothetical protein
MMFLFALMNGLAVARACGTDALISVHSQSEVSNGTAGAVAAAMRGVQLLWTGLWPGCSHYGTFGLFAGRKLVAFGRKHAYNSNGTG